MAVRLLILTFLWSISLLLFNNRFLRIDEGKQHGTDDEHDGNHVEGQVIVARLLHEFSKQNATAEASDVTGGIHGTGERACLLFAQVDAERPGGGQHEVEDAEAEREEHEDRHLARNEGGKEHADGRHGERRGAERLATDLDAIAARQPVGQVTTGDIANHAHDERYGHGIGQFRLVEAAPQLHERGKP